MTSGGHNGPTAGPPGLSRATFFSSYPFFGFLLLPVLNFQCTVETRVLPGREGTKDGMEQSTPVAAQRALFFLKKKHEDCLIAWGLDGGRVVFRSIVLCYQPAIMEFEKEGDE